MINNYKTIDYSEFSLPGMKVVSEDFHYQDLFHLVGKSQFMTTFELTRGSPSFLEYGEYVLGVIFYDRKTLDSLKSSSQTGLEINRQRIRIDNPSQELSKKKKGDLKYRGINVEDIASISFLTYKREPETYETGEKKIPDIIYIEADCSNIDADILNQNYLISKHNSGTNLVQYEKEQLIGITLALNNGQIDSRILKELCFTEEDLKINLNIWMSLYKVKERRNQLTEVDKTNYIEVKGILSLGIFNKVLKELIDSGVAESLKYLDTKNLKKIFEAVGNFSPSILMHGKKQIYWNVDSYIHIALRHLKAYQMGKFRLKTVFSYKTEDIKSLIEKVLQRIESEIEDYLSSEEKDDFVRHGKMAIYYNGDHYHLRVNSHGRIIQFHAVDAAPNKLINTVDR